METSVFIKHTFSGLGTNCFSYVLDRYGTRVITSALASVITSAMTSAKTSAITSAMTSAITSALTTFHRRSS